MSLSMVPGVTIIAGSLYSTTHCLPMIALIIGLVFAVVVVLELVFAQAWFRIFVFGFTLYRDDNPVGYWLVVALQSAVALGLLWVGVMGLIGGR